MGCVAGLFSLGGGFRRLDLCGAVESVRRGRRLDVCTQPRVLVAIDFHYS